MFPELSAGMRACMDISLLSKLFSFSSDISASDSMTLLKALVWRCAGVTLSVGWSCVSMGVRYAAKRLMWWRRAEVLRGMATCMWVTLVAREPILS